MWGSWKDHLWGEHMDLTGCLSCRGPHPHRIGPVREHPRHHLPCACSYPPPSIAAMHLRASALGHSDAGQLPPFEPPAPGSLLSPQHIDASGQVTDVPGCSPSPSRTGHCTGRPSVADGQRRLQRGAGSPPSTNPGSLAAPGWLTHPWTASAPLLLGWLPRATCSLFCSC